MLKDKAERKAFQRVINNPGTSFRVSNMCSLCWSVRLTLRKQPSQMKKYISIFQAIFLMERGQSLWIMDIFKSKQTAFLYPSWRGSEGEYRSPKPLSLQIHCLLPDLSEAAIIVSSVVYLLPLVSPSNSSSTQLQHNLPKVPATEPGTLWLKASVCDHSLESGRTSPSFLTCNMLLESWTKYLMFSGHALCFLSTSLHSFYSLLLRYLPSIHCSPQFFSTEILSIVMD